MNLLKKMYLAEQTWRGVKTRIERKIRERVNRGRNFKPQRKNTHKKKNWTSLTQLNKHRQKENKRKKKRKKKMQQRINSGGNRNLLVKILRKNCERKEGNVLR